MRLPLVLTALSLAAFGLAQAVPGWGDIGLVGLVAALAGVTLVVRAGFGRSRTPPPAARDWVVVDGSNVLHWNGNTPELQTVKQVVKALSGRGMTPGVVFDANVGYKIGDRYQDDAELARRLGLPADRVLVVPKGTPADEYVLQAARDLGARVVSNDRFRDWSAAHPEVADAGFLIRGGFRDGALWLEGLQGEGERA